MREKAKGIDKAMNQAKSKARAEDDMIKQVWRDKYLGLRNYKNR